MSPRKKSIEQQSRQVRKVQEKVDGLISSTSILDDLVESKRSIEQQSRQVRKEVDHLISRIRKGERITDDPLKDFCITTHGMEFEDAYKKADAIAKKLEKAKGGPALIVNEIGGRRTVVFCEPGPNETAAATARIYRVGNIEGIERTNHGIEIPNRYAYFIGLESQFSDIPFRECLLYLDLPNAWKPAKGPMTLGAAEIFDNHHELWLAGADKKVRPDLDENIRHDIYETFNHIDEKQSMETHIVVGKDLKTLFDTDKYTRASLIDARCCIEHGMNFTAYQAQQAADLRTKQQEIFEKAVQAILREHSSTDIASVLLSAHDLGVHKTDIELTPALGMRVKASEYLPPLYEKYDVRR